MPNLSCSASLRRIVLDAEQLAEVEPGLVDVVLVVLDEAGALAHHALPEAVEQFHVVLVVGDGQEAASLVVPGQRIVHNANSSQVLMVAVSAAKAALGSRHLL